MEDAWKHVDAALKASHAPPNQETMESIWRASFNVWRDSFARSFRPTHWSMHRCEKQTCRIETILVDYALCKPEPSDVTAGRSHGIMHICIRVKRDGQIVHSTELTDEGEVISTTDIVHCSGSTDHSRAWSSRDCIARGRVDNLYVCADTGHVHVCTSDGCPYGVHLSEMHGDTVCALTGRVLEDRKMVSIYWMPAATPSSNGDTFGGDTERRSRWTGSSGSSSSGSSTSVSSSGGISSSSSNNGSVVESDIAYVDDMSLANGPMVDVNAAIEHVLAASRRRPINRRPYSKFINLARFKVSTLFSRQSHRIKLQTHRNDLRLANREVVKHFRTNKHVDAVTLLSVQTRALRKRGTSWNYDLSSEERESFYASYARRCVNFWCVIRSRTRLGRDEPNLFPLMEFVVAAMYTFARGIYLPPEVTGSSGEHLIDQDQVLACWLPQYGIIDQLGCVQSVIAGVEKAIEDAIIGAVRDEHVDPKTLHPSSIRSEQLDESIFRTTRKGKPAAGDRDK